jgi:Spy/CpxP family protein refolding chaperone
MSSSGSDPGPGEKRKSIREAFEEPLRKAREAVREAHKAYLEATRGDALDEAQVRQAARAWADQMAEEAILRAKRTQELQAGMTPEQRERLEQARTAVRERLKETVDAVKARLVEKRSAAKNPPPKH